MSTLETQMLVILESFLGRFFLLVMWRSLSSRFQMGEAHLSNGRRKTMHMLPRKAYRKRRADRMKNIMYGVSTKRNSQKIVNLLSSFINTYICSIVVLQPSELIRTEGGSINPIDWMNVLYIQVNRKGSDIIDWYHNTQWV